MIKKSFRAYITSNLMYFLTCCFLALLGMDNLSHYSHSLHLITWSNRENVPVKMNRTALIVGIRKYFRYGFEHSEVFISDD